MVGVLLQNRVRDLDALLVLLELILSLEVLAVELQTRREKTLRRAA